MYYQGIGQIVLKLLGGRQYIFSCAAAAVPPPAAALFVLSFKYAPMNALYEKNAAAGFWGRLRYPFPQHIQA